jgi:hypothetical protein
MLTGLVIEKPSLAMAMNRMLMTGASTEDIEDAINTRLLARRERDKTLLELFGAPLYMNTTLLSRAGQKPLGPALGPDGRELIWSVWSPHRNALLDIFRRRIPDEEELKARMVFAREHEVKYAVVRPGYIVTLDHLKGWLGS